jgi:hypothetical protein
VVDRRDAAGSRTRRLVWFTDITPQDRRPSSSLQAAMALTNWRRANGRRGTVESGGESRGAAPQTPRRAAFGSAAPAGSTRARAPRAPRLARPRAARRGELSRLKWAPPREGGGCGRRPSRFRRRASRTKRRGPTSAPWSALERSAAASVTASESDPLRISPRAGSAGRTEGPASLVPIERFAPLAALAGSPAVARAPSARAVEQRRPAAARRHSRLRRWPVDSRGARASRC